MSLPKDFLWGFGSSAYQIEGAIEKDGRGPSIWDSFCLIPGNIKDHSSGLVACDAYNRTTEDIALIKSLGVKAYRFSISWSRIIPLGGRRDLVNELAIDHYIKFVDDLIDAGITPFVTLFHWDVPEALEQRYGGLLGRTEFPLDFEHYARIVFAALPRVKHWTTFNEPWCSAIMGYSVGSFAPGHKHAAATEPWIAGHTMLVAHARAVKLFRDGYQKQGGGEIGMVLNGDAAYPWDATDPRDVAACNRRLEFQIGWFADPIYFGTYPSSMRRQLGKRLPSFTDEERALVKGSNDYYGLNHYTANYIKYRPGIPDGKDYTGNVDVVFQNKQGNWIGDETESPWLRPCAPGFRDLLRWISNRYMHPKIYVTENGTSIKGESSLSTTDVLEDDFRVKYYDEYIRSMATAVRLDGVNVGGYFAWSLMDNFEWADGYRTRFGSVYVTFGDHQKRYPKKSAGMFKPLFDQLIKTS